MLFRSLRLASFTLLITASTTAFAHSRIDVGSHHDAFFQGLVHPLTGWDHFIAMLAVGMWSALVLKRQQIWLAPLAFVSTLTIGALAGFAGLQIFWTEPMIAASLLVLGLFVATRQALPLSGMLALVASFALFHGLAHGQELAHGQRLAALTGMLITTAALHLAGVALGQALLMKRRWQQIFGSAMGLMGGYSLLQLAL